MESQKHKQKLTKNNMKNSILLLSLKNVANKYNFSFISCSFKLPMNLFNSFRISCNSSILNKMQIVDILNILRLWFYSYVFPVHVLEDSFSTCCKQFRRNHMLLPHFFSNFYFICLCGTELLQYRHRITLIQLMIITLLSQ